MWILEEETEEMTLKVPIRADRGQMSREERQSEIVTTAASLFKVGSYSATSMDDIARAAGLAKPTLYHYFESKDKILFAIHEEVQDLLQARHSARLAAGLAPNHMLFESMVDIMELAETMPGHQRVYVEQQRELPMWAQDSLRVRKQEYFEAITAVIERGIEEGIFQTSAPQLVTRQIFGQCTYFYQWYAVGSDPRVRDIACVFWDNLMDGIEA